MTTRIAAALVFALLPLAAQAEEIVVSNYGVTTNGMPYAVAMAKGFFKQQGADVTGILSSDGSVDLRRSLQSVLNEIPADQRDLIELVYFYGMTHNDISETMQIPLGTVKTRIRLGMQKLRTAWSSATGIEINPKAEN